jgi:hypothetical protein
MNPERRSIVMRPNHGWFLVVMVMVVGVFVLPGRAVALDPAPANCYYVPEAGPVGTPVVGTAATQLFHACPNNDGNSSLPNHVRIKVILKDVNGDPAFTAKGNICVQLNGGTPAQGFSGTGADSIIANSTWNQTPRCPNLTCIEADADPVGGVAYITFTGGDPLNPGVALRNPCRKWGHYDTAIPVQINGVNIVGRLLEGSPTPAYTLRIKNLDWAGGLGAILNLGETVTTADYNGVLNSYRVNNVISYWKDFNYDGVVNLPDVNMLRYHLTHNCATPNDDAGGCP